MERSVIRETSRSGPRIALRSIRASVTGLYKSIPFALSSRRGRASVRDRRKAVAWWGSWG